MMELLHGELGDAILIRQKDLPNPSGGGRDYTGDR